MKKVQVLMSTYNGEKYIKEQIVSILEQEEVEVTLLIRDDGSTDNTIKIINDIAQKNDNVSLYIGENVGPARSFMNLIENSEDVSYYAFSDQDDVWDSKKLISAINKMKDKQSEPTLYMSALQIVDENLKDVGIKKVQGNFSFEGEMIKNFATGCTQVFNKELCDILKEYIPNYIIMHDSWITRVCYAIGGNVIIDEQSYIKYRQHTNNVVGYKDKIIPKLKKQYEIAFKNKISMRANIAEELKKGYEERLTKETKLVIDNLINYRSNTKAKKWLLSNKKFRTTNSILNIKMDIAILLNKF